MSFTRILIDAKDLINIVEHGIPISSDEFDSFLKTHNAALILTHTNICEFVAPISMGRDFLSVRPLLQRIEAFPVRYLREPSIPAEEILAALEGFNKEREPQAINPYVPRWDCTFHLVGSVPTQNHVEYRLDEIVYDLFREAPKIFKGYGSKGPTLRQQFADDRKLSVKMRKNLAANFVESLRKYQKQRNLDYGTVDVHAFGSWIYQNPSRCPGLRLAYDLRNAIMANPGDIPLDSDIPDIAHVFAIPYAEAATIDRRMMSYFLTVTKRLKTINPAIAYDRYTHRSIGELMKSL